MIDKEKINKKCGQNLKKEGKKGERKKKQRARKRDRNEQIEED